MDILDLVHDDQKSEDRPFQCKFKGCPKAFSRRSDLQRACPYRGCGKTFIQRSALTVHLRVHTGERPHVCETCSKAFSDSSSLARHRRIHSGRRPYRCLVEGCGKSYCRKTTLTKHTRRNHAAVLRSAQHRNAAGSGPLAIGSNSAPALFGLNSAPLQPSHSWPSAGVHSHAHAHPHASGGAHIHHHHPTHAVSLSLDASAFAQQAHQNAVMRNQALFLRPHHPSSAGADESNATLSSLSNTTDDDRLSQKSDSSFNGGANTTHSSISQPFSPIDETPQAHSGVFAATSAGMHPTYYYPQHPDQMSAAAAAEGGAAHDVHVPQPPMPYFRNGEKICSPVMQKYGSITSHADVMPGMVNSFDQHSIHPAYHSLNMHAPAAYGQAAGATVGGQQQSSHMAYEMSSFHSPMPHAMMDDCMPPTPTARDIPVVQGHAHTAATENHFNNYYATTSGESTNSCAVVGTGQSTPTGPASAA